MGIHPPLHRRRIAVLLVSTLLATVAVVSPAGAAPDVGYDISYPQCGRPLPTDPAFGIVGVNGGRAFTENPCLADQLAWAKKAANRAPAFYANTGNPGPLYSKRWPIGQTSPRVCSNDAPNSAACSFDYGWNAAKDSFANAARASQAVNGIDLAAAAHRVADVKWWLDVEILNTWQTLEDAYGPTSTSKWNDVYALTGAVRALWDSGVDFVGIYSTKYQWDAITGGSAYAQDWFSANPVWLAGFDADSAPRGCSKPSFTDGPVMMTQYHLDGFDANYVCP